jgi:hypothetical protein
MTCPPRDLTSDLPGAHAIFYFVDISPRCDLLIVSPLLCDHNARDRKMCSYRSDYLWHRTFLAETPLQRDRQAVICRRFITCDRSRRGFSICKVTTAFAGAGVPHRRV